jgi:hypothetical protein
MSNTPRTTSPVSTITVGFKHAHDVNVFVTSILLALLPQHTSPTVIYCRPVYAARLGMVTIVQMACCSALLLACKPLPESQSGSHMSPATA